MSEVGKKAERLSRMKEAGINVPDFICISSEKTQTQLEIERKQFIREEEKLLYAVRSSSFCEDGSDFSFAGQFDTYLNVTKEDLATKIKQCFASKQNASVQAYCNQTGFDARQIRMSVIVQQMVNADLSGIMFSANPQGLLNETVIVVGSGLGDQVVSDQVETTSYYYNRTDNTKYYEAFGNSPKLSEEKVKELVGICEQLEVLFGERVDVEFAISEDITYVLQCRPITSLNEKLPLIYDNSNIVESYPGITLPLTISFIQEAYYGVFKGIASRVLKNDALIKAEENTFHNMLGSVNGRVYYQISNWYEIIRFLPMNRKIIPIWQDMMGVSSKDQPYEKSKLSLYRRMMTYLNVVYEALNIQRNMKQLNENFRQITKVFDQEFSEHASIEDIKVLYSKISDQVLANWDVTLLNDMYAFLFTGLVKKSLKKKVGDDYERQTNQFISGISNIESMKPIRELLSLCEQSIPRMEELRAIRTVSECREYLDQNPKYKEQFENYIKLYGDRTLEELKLETRTFRTHPLKLIEQIIEYGKDEERLREMIQNLCHDQEFIKEEFVFKKQAWHKHGLTSIFAKKASQGIKNREISRLNRTRVYGMVRQMFLHIGHLLFKESKIDQVEDIFWLKKEEIFCESQVSNYRELIQKRKSEYELYEKLPAFTRLIFDKKAFHKVHQSVGAFQIMRTQTDTLYGTPCSNGRVTAKAVVIEDVRIPVCTKDQILVTKMTDPGWVFLLANAKGIISEKGSLLSHTAIISRELKIPAIVGVQNAISLIKTGDVITIDGERGTIRFEEGDE